MGRDPVRAGYRLMRTHFVIATPALDAGVGNLVAVATVVRRRVFSLIEIATWFDRLTMSGCAPRNDRLKRVRVRGITGCGAGNPTLYSNYYGAESG